MDTKIFRWWINASITAIIIQSVWIGGGFGTGREIVEFMAKYGTNAWMGIVVSAITTFIALFLSFEVARKFKAFDYMTWSKQFLWKFWPAFDIAYIILAWIVIAVVGAAAATILEDLAGIPFMAGAALIIIIIGLLHFFGREAIEAWWIVGTIGLYAMYFVIWAVTLAYRGSVSLQNLSRGISMGTPVDAVVDGFRYTLYNLVVVMAALQSVDRYRSSKESAAASLFSIALVHGAIVAIWLCFMGFYPDIIEEPVPWYAILKTIGMAWVIGLYVFWIFYTLIETALGMIYAVVRRLDAQLALHGKKLKRSQEAIIATIILLLSLITAQVGIVTLVAKGYGTLAWVFFAVYFIPIATVGVYRLINPEWKREFWAKA